MTSSMILRCASLKPPRGVALPAEMHERVEDEGRKAQPIDDDELALIEQRYRAERLKRDSTCRHDLQTLLNNFPSEVDRATLWKEQQRSQDNCVTKPPFVHEHYREMALT